MSSGLILIGVAIGLVLILINFLDYYAKCMAIEDEKIIHDTYLAEQARLSYEISKNFSCKPNKLTAINAVKVTKHEDL